MKKIIGLLIFIFVVSVSFGENKIKLSFLTSPLSNVSREVLETAYERIGYKVEFVPLPPARALTESSKGKIDGETHRISSVGTRFPSLKMVSVPINHFELRAYSIKHDFPITSKDDLSGYKIGVKRGVVIAENYTKGLNVDLAVDDLTNFKKMSGNRTDIIVTTDVNATAVLQKHNFENVKKLEPALATVKLYHFLHESKSYLIPEITKILKEMETSGEITEIRNKILGI